MNNSLNAVRVLCYFTSPVKVSKNPKTFALENKTVNHKQLSSNKSCTVKHHLLLADPRLLFWQALQSLEFTFRKPAETLHRMVISEHISAILKKHALFYRASVYKLKEKQEYFSYTTYV